MSVRYTVTPRRQWHDWTFIILAPGLAHWGVNGEVQGQVGPLVHPP